MDNQTPPEPSNGIERVNKKGTRYYRKVKHERPPIANLMGLPLEVARSIFAVEGDAPSVTTVLGALAKPALIGWASREERKMISALAGNLYGRLYQIVDEPVDAAKFVELLTEEAGKGAHLKLLAKASNVGTEVHAKVEWEFKGELGLERAAEAPPLTTLQAERAFKRWTEWRAQVNLKVVAIEKRLYSSLFGFGGTLDLLAEVDATTAVEAPLLRKLVVIDFKTGKRVYAEAFLQNVAYRMALAEEGIHTTGGIIVRLPKYEDDPEFDAAVVPDDPTLATTFLALLVVYKWWSKEHDSKRKPKKETKDGGQK